MAEDNEKKEVITNPARLLAASSESTAEVVKALSPLEKIAASIKEGFSSFGKKLDKQIGATKVGAEQKVEANRASKDAKNNRDAMLKKLSGLYKNSLADRIASKAAAKASKVMRNHWGKLLLLGLFFIPKETWIKIGTYALKLFNVLREIDWAGVFKTLGNAIVQIVDFLIPIFEWFGKKLFGEKATEDEFKKQETVVAEKQADFDNTEKKSFFGIEESDSDFAIRKGKENASLLEAIEKRDGMGGFKKDKDGNEKFEGKRQGGLFGENRGIMDVVTGLGSLALILAPTSMLFLGFKALTGTIGIARKALGLIPKVPAIKPQMNAPRNTAARNAEATRLKGLSKEERRAERATQKANARAGGGTPKASTPKVPGQKLLTQGSGASKVPKSPAAGGSKPGMMMKALKKFPKLAKAMPVLKQIPVIGKVFTAGAIGMALAGGAGKKELIPMIGGLFGGAGGAILGSAIGGILGVAGGPLALVTALLGGIGGAVAGDTLGIGVAQWLMGEKVDAFGFGFGWVNDILNGGGAPSEGSGSPAASAPATPAAPKPPPMTKNQFLQSEKYKGQMRGADGVVAGESSGGKDMAYDEYLENEKKAPIVKASAKAIKKELKTIKRLPEGIRTKRYAKLNRYLDTNPNGDAILAQLKPREKEQLSRGGGSGSSGSGSSGITVTPPVARVSPQQKTNALKQSTDKLLDGKSGQQSASVNIGGATHNKTVTTSTQSTVIAQDPAGATQNKFWDEG